MTAKRKKSDSSPPRQQAGVDGSSSSAAAAAFFSPLSASTSPAGALGLDSPSESSPFVFSAGVGGSGSSESSRQPSSIAALGSRPADDVAEAATQRLVEACRAGDPVSAAIRLPTAEVNHSTRQGAAAGFSAPPLWWCVPRTPWQQRWATSGSQLGLSAPWNGAPFPLLPLRVEALSHSPSLTSRAHTPRAAECGHPECVSLLIQHGADVEGVDEREGTTALHRAAYGGHVAAVELLISAGANLEAVSRRNGATPLHLAARASRAEVVVRLLNAGADLGHRNKRGESALCVTTDPLTIRSLLDPTLLPHTADAAALARSALLRDAAGGSGGAGGAAAHSEGSGSSGNGYTLPAAAAAVAAAAAAAVATATPGDAAPPAASKATGSKVAAGDADASKATSASAPPASGHGGHLVPASSPSASSNTRPFVRVRPMTALFFERALEEARKRIDTHLGVYPYDLLARDERMVVLAKVAVALAGYGACESNAVTESALFNIFACARERVEAEAEAAVVAAAAEASASTAITATASDAKSGVTAPTAKSGEVWRLLLAGAFTEEWGSDRVTTYDLLGGGGGSPLRPEVWGTLVDMVAERALFGREFYGIKKALFLERDPVQQRLLYTQLLSGASSSSSGAAGGAISTLPPPAALPSTAAALGERPKWFSPRPPPPSDAELGEAERQIAALLPKGREVLCGVFPADHFASKMTMRQLVFSVEGACSSYCSCDSCVRCRSAVEKLHRQHQKEQLQLLGGGGGKGGASGPLVLTSSGSSSGSSDKGHTRGSGHHSNGPSAHAPGGPHSGGSPAQPFAHAAAAGPGGDAVLTALPPGSSSAMRVAAVAAAAVASGGVPPGGGALGPAGWEALQEAKNDVAKFWSGLSAAQRREALHVFAPDLDRSMTVSPDWDILVSAELSYSYGGGKTALVEYDSGKDCFTPGPPLLNDTQFGGLQALLGSLHPKTTNEVAHWRDPRKSGGGSAGGAAPLLAEYGKQLLEVHFVRLFAIKLLVRFGDAARAIAAQEVLEALLREEEESAARNASKAARKKEKEKAKAKQRDEAAAAARAAAAAAAEEEERQAEEAAAKAAKAAAAARAAREEAERKQEEEYQSMRKEALARADAERAAAAAAADAAAAAAEEAAAAAAAAASGGADDGGGGSKSRRKRGGSKKAAGPDSKSLGGATTAGGDPASPSESAPGAALSAEDEMLARAIKASLEDEAVRKARQAEGNALASAPAMRPPSKARTQPQAPVQPPPVPPPGVRGVSPQFPPPLPQGPPPPHVVLAARANGQLHATPPPPPPPSPPPPPTAPPPLFSQPPNVAPPGPFRGPTHVGAPGAPTSASLLNAAPGATMSRWAGPPGWSSAPQPPAPQQSSPWSSSIINGAADELSRLRLATGGQSAWAEAAVAAASAAPQPPAQQHRGIGGLVGAGTPPVPSLMSLALTAASTDLSVTAAAFKPNSGGGSGAQHHGGGGAHYTAFSTAGGGHATEPPPGFGPRGTTATVSASFLGGAAATQVQQQQPQQHWSTASVDAAFASLLHPDGAAATSSSPVLPFTDGVMFVCTKFTQEECLRRRLLGLPRRDLDLVANCTPGRSALFLFNFTTRQLHGVFVASSRGQLNVECDAWKRSLYHRPGSGRAGMGTSPFPSQVRFSVVRDFSPLPEESFAHLLRGSNRVARLDAQQVRELCRLFVQNDLLHAVPNASALMPGANNGSSLLAAGGLGASAYNLQNSRLATGGFMQQAPTSPPTGSRGQHQQPGRLADGFGDMLGGRGVNGHSAAGGRVFSLLGSSAGGGRAHGSLLGASNADDPFANSVALAALGVTEDDTDVAMHAAAASVEMLFDDDVAGGHHAGAGGGVGGYADEPEEGICAICVEQPVDVQLLPCRHSSFCYTCVADLAICPLCRSTVMRIEALGT